MPENEVSRSCYEECDHYREGSCRYEEWLGTGKPKSITPGDECLFPAQCALNSICFADKIDITEEDNQDLLRKIEILSRKKRYSLREKIGVGIQVGGITTMIGGAIGHCLQASNSPSFMYTAMAGLVAIFTGSFISGIQRQE